MEGLYRLQSGDNDLTVKRNNVIYYTLEMDGSNKLMNFASNGAVSANKLFGNYFQTGVIQLIQSLKVQM